MLHRITLFLTGLLGLSSLTAPAQTLNTAKLDSLLTALATHHKAMGSLALSRNGAVVYSRAFGYQQLADATKTPATPATRYRIGSVSKVFTATMIFQLIDEGKLTLTTPLAAHFPQLPNAPAITIDHLLSHRSGLHSFTGDAAYPGYMTKPQTQAEMLARIAAAKPDFAPGTKTAYSNTNYVVLGYLVEKLTNQPYAQALQQRVAAKADLKNTYYGNKIGAQPQESFSYTAGSGGWQPAPETDMSIPGGAGAVVSTPTDLDRFLEALFGGKLVSAASLNTMKTITDGLGRGLFQLSFGKKISYGHNGIIDGFTAMIGYFPDDKLAVAVCTNAQAYSINDLMLGVLSIYFQHPYKLPDFQASTFTPAPADLDRYAGTYASPQFPLKITLTKAGALLQAQATGQPAFFLEPVRKDVFKFDPAKLRMEFTPTKPEFTLQQGGGTYVFSKEQGR